MRKALIYPALSAFSLYALGAGTFVTAQGWSRGAANGESEDGPASLSAMYQAEARLLGVSVDEIKIAWAEGKTLPEPAAAKGVNTDELQQRMLEARKAATQELLPAFASQEVASQGLADQRFAFMVNHLAHGPPSA
jgi:hypothetical protein